MNKNKTFAGSLLFIGGILYVLGTVIGDKYGNTLIYNTSVFLLGLFMIAGAYFIQQAFKSGLFSILLVIAGIGTLGVGVLPQDSTIYFAFAAIGYVAFALSAVMSYKYEKPPLSYLSVVLAVFSLIALILWAADIELGSGIKVTPILVDFPVLLWLVGFGAHIIGKSNDTTH